MFLWAAFCFWICFGNNGLFSNAAAVYKESLRVANEKPNAKLKVKLNVVLAKAAQQTFQTTRRSILCRRMA